MKSRFLYSIRVLNRLKTKTRIGFPGKPKTGLLTDEVSLVNFWNSQYREPTDAGGLGIDKCFICPDGGIGRRVCLKSRCLWRESSSLSLGTSGVSLIMLAMLNNQRECSL